MNWQTILELQCEGGSIRLVGSTIRNKWLFRFDTEEWALSEEGGGSNQSGTVEGIHAARQMLDERYPYWKHFHASYLAPEFAEYFTNITMESQLEQADNTVVQILEGTIEKFIRDFAESPYDCYTEHGQHALFFTKLYNALPEDKRYHMIEVAPGHKERVCTIQKEYRTKVDLGKKRRQNWDIAVIKEPDCHVQNNYDYLPLSAIVEFGMNEGLDHLVDDFLRVSHPEANADHRYIVHLYRLSGASDKISGRDWSANARDIKKRFKEIKELLEQMSAGDESILANDPIKNVLDTRTHEKQESCKPITVYLAIADITGKQKNEILKFLGGTMSNLP
jgi:hypothetical protein